MSTCTCTDVHTHIVPENFPVYAGSNANVPWPSMAEAHACHRHVMISGKVYRTVADGSWSVPRRISHMDEARVTRHALSPMPELLSYWLPLDDAKVLIRYLNDSIAGMIDEAPDRFRPGLRAAAGRGRGDPRTRIRGQHAEVLRRGNRLARERCLDR